MTSRTKFLYTLLLSSACLTAPTLAAAAQPQANGSQVVGLEEVVVTARKTDENLQTTPVAVTALNSAGLVQRQVGNVADIQRVTPNIQIITGAPATPGFAIVAMRGEYNLNANSEADPSIAIYVDGVYIARDAGSLLNLTDLERVEVLRGPQGTLFGRNTTGGAINVITAKPTGDLEGFAQGTIGNYKLREGALMLNVPIKGDEIDARINYQYREHGGYAHDPITNRPLNDQKGDNLIRGELKIAPDGQNWDILLTGDYDKNSDSGQENSFVAINAAANPVIGLVAPAVQKYIQNSSNWYSGFGGDDTAISGNPNFYAHEFSKNYGVSGTLNADFGGVKMKSITAYRGMNTLGSNDLDGTPAAILWSQTQYVQHQFSEELQFSGEAGPIRWIGGAFYFTEHGTERSDSQAFGFLGLPPSLNFGNYKNSSEAAFLQVYYQITDRLEATGGIRYTWDQRDVVIHNQKPYDFATDTGVCVATNIVQHPSDCNTPENANFSYPAWTAGLDFQATPTILVYVKTSGASMAGGWNLRVSDVPAFSPETVRDVELGAKADWFDHRLRTNIALFHSWKNNIQQQVTGLFGTPPTTTLFTANGGAAQINGLEFEGTVVPWSGMEIATGLGWMNGKYDKGSYNDKDIVNGVNLGAGCTNLAGGAQSACVVDRSGEPLLQFPKVTFNIGATQTVPLSFGSLVAHLDYSWTDKVHFYTITGAPQQSAAVDATYATANQLGVLKARGLLNGVLTLKLSKPQIDISVWGKNLTNEKYLTWGLPQYAAYGGALGLETGFVGDPRTYGVTLKYRFGG